MWLCVTNITVQSINEVAMQLLGYNLRERPGNPSDPHVGESMQFYAHPGVTIRLTRNLDKQRGYVNGAVGVVKQLLHYTDGVPTVFTVELSSGAMVLVHPVCDQKRWFIPCTYGYATTIRRSQGGTYQHGCIWFDHCYPPERGYGYVAASRFTTSSGIYLIHKIRRTDWLPVRPIGAEDYDVTRRGEESQSDYDDGDECDVARDRRGDMDDYALSSGHQSGREAPLF